MRKLIIFAIILLIALPVSAEINAKAKEKNTQVINAKTEVKKFPVPKPHKRVSHVAPIKLKTEEQKTLYGLGLVIARQMEVFNLSTKELQIVKQGIYDGVKGRKSKVDFTMYSKKSMEMGLARRDAHGKQLAAKSPGYMELAEAEEGALKSSTGVIYLSLREGVGANPVETDKVKFHQRATLIDGKEVESSYKRGEADTGVLNESLPCLGEAVKLMKPGGKAKIVCPPETAFAKEGYGAIPPNAVLVFEVELLEILKP